MFNLPVGIGPKRAIDLIKQYKTIEEIVKHIDTKVIHCIGVYRVDVFLIQGSLFVYLSSYLAIPKHKLWNNVRVLKIGGWDWKNTIGEKQVKIYLHLARSNVWFIYMDPTCTLSLDYQTARFLLLIKQAVEKRAKTVGENIAN